MQILASIKCIPSDYIQWRNKMRLTTRNPVLAVFYAFLRGVSVSKAENIMLAKPSKLNRVYWNAEYANDGNNNPGSTPARSRYTVNPYWQGDLQGYFTVHNISVTSDVTHNLEKDLGSAYVEVHASGNSGCPDDIFICGQCPEVVGKGETFTFTCSHPQPVRFVKVRRNMTGRLVISEVVVQGTPATTSAAPNCLLATNPEDAAEAMGWSKFTIDGCSSYDSCE
ncbi:uncharacterized protein LOC124255348 [Haliotis rubra]|uniref:uncharacterized protein LOC124255348 n=1 Tax=Haliotis rubra TaxID=36100 RepID=UPI001EE544A2|nr:uncharacterized protein LOC124255348 [Haliotis rubra]